MRSASGTPERRLVQGRFSELTHDEQRSWARPRHQSAGSSLMQLGMSASSATRCRTDSFGVDRDEITGAEVGGALDDEAARLAGERRPEQRSLGVRAEVGSAVRPASAGSSPSSSRTRTDTTWLLPSGPTLIRTCRGRACRPDRRGGRGRRQRSWRQRKRRAVEEGGGERVVVVGPPAAPAVEALGAAGPVPQRDGVRVASVDAAPDGWLRCGRWRRRSRRAARSGRLASRP